MIETPYMPRNWYWIVGGDETRAWSSAAAIAAGNFAAGYVDLPDEGFTVAAPDGYSRISSEAELRDLEIAIVSGLDMLGRLTDAEYIAIRQAEVANYATIGRWLDALRVNGQINLFGYTAEAARVGLVQDGLLTTERAATVFAP